MKTIKSLLAILFAVLIMAAFPLSAFAVNQGVYTGTVYAYYSNPDTGAPDDSSSDPDLGTSMVKSATGTTALVESDGTNQYVTLRLLLQSNVSNVSFAVRTGNNTYSGVNYEVTGSNSSNDSKDYRIKVSDPSAYFRCTMYVAPMGRDVVWYIKVDTSSLSSGSGDFNSKITLQSQTASTQTTQQTTEQTASNDQQTDTAQEDQQSVDEQTSADEELTSAEAESSEITENAENEENTAADTAEESTAKFPWVWVIVAVVLICGGAVILLKKNKK